MLMPHATPEARALHQAAQTDLEAMLGEIDRQLDGLGDALRRRDLGAIESHAQHLHLALARAVDGFTLASRGGPVPLNLRNRLAAASGKVAAQRESLGRAMSALDRAIDVLMPRDEAPVYGGRGATGWGVRGASAYNA
jgi:hypothetical protein